jgi:hypothetical protein
MTSNLRSYVLLVALSALLAGCSKCDCPKCPDRTTIVNPAPGTTVVEPQ